MLKESLRMSISNIVANKMRSFLTILGIIIGVMAIIALITVMESATGEVTAQFENLGTGKLTVQANGTALKSGLRETDLAKIEDLPNVSGISPSLSQTLSVVYSGEMLEDVAVKGNGYAYFQRTLDAVEKGRPLLPIDCEQRSRVCLIDSDLAHALFSGEEPLGKQLLIKGTRFTIIGLLADPDVDDVMSQLQAGSENGTLIMPYTTYMRLFGVKGVTGLEVYVTDSDLTNQTVEDIEAVLDESFNYHDNSYNVINMESLLDVMDTMMSLMTNLLVGIASIALLVGGIGIMNMMLVSVTERTGEIGLRKALGAKPRSIQVQFLMESVILSLLGGIIGVALGLAVSKVLSNMMNIAFVFSPGAVALGVCFSLAVGVIFGWAPARKASNLNPIDALRSV
ncbi:MAG: FtsX-like permease family protein [Clostridiales bacterium]|nr:FtsX-like permease family protein [Clostridiales bacterium]